MSEQTPLNINSRSLCERLGLGYHSKLLKDFRELNLIRFFKVGKKYLYYAEDVKPLNEKLRKGEVKIKTDEGTYYVTIQN